MLQKQSNQHFILRDGQIVWIKSGYIAVCAPSPILSPIATNEKFWATWLLSEWARCENLPHRLLIWSSLVSDIDMLRNMWSLVSSDEVAMEFNSQAMFWTDQIDKEDHALIVSGSANMNAWSFQNDVASPFLEPMKRMVEEYYQPPRSALSFSEEAAGLLVELEGGRFSCLGKELEKQHSRWLKKQKKEKGFDGASKLVASIGSQISVIGMQIATKQFSGSRPCLLESYRFQSEDWSDPLAYSKIASRLVEVLGTRLNGVGDNVELLVMDQSFRRGAGIIDQTQKGLGAENSRLTIMTGGPQYNRDAIRMNFLASPAKFAVLLDMLQTAGPEIVIKHEVDC